jgi:hypothetical protein
MPAGWRQSPAVLRAGAVLPRSPNPTRKMGSTLRVNFNGYGSGFLE